MTSPPGVVALVCRPTASYSKVAVRPIASVWATALPETKSVVVVVTWAAEVPAPTVVVIDWVPASTSRERSKVVTISSGPPPGSSRSGSAPGAQASRRRTSSPSSSYS